MHISLLVFPYLGNLLITITTNSHSSQMTLFLQSNVCKKNGEYPHLRLFVSQQYNQHSQSQHSLFGTHSFPFSALATSEGLSHHSYLNTLTSHPERAAFIHLNNASIEVPPKAFTTTSKQSEHHLGEVWEVYSTLQLGEGLLEIDTVITSTKHSAPTSIRSRTVRSVLLTTPLSLTLNPQFVTVKETGSVLLFLAHLQRLQRVTIYTSQEGEEHTSHNELHELNTAPAPNTQRMQR